jgi:cellulose synthase/poly-beta-1,6-N-acetylglucosamine synthase-like glycosyltransferase
MYLAEDRILSLGIYCQMDSKYILRYVPDAIAYTDPMKDHENLMNQRRRWINSSLFAFLYVYKNYYYNVMDSNHNFCRKYCTLNLSMIIALLSMLNAYITPALYFFVLYSTIYQLGFPGAEWVAKLVCMLYCFVFFSAVGGAITGRQWSKRAHVISVVLAGFTFLMILLVIYNVLFIYLRITKNPLYVPKPN